MALAKNQKTYPLALTGGGSIAPGEIKNIDPNQALEAAYLISGSLIIKDPDVDPDPLPEPLLNAPRETFFGTTAPPGMDVGDIWFRTDGEGNILDVQEMKP